MTTHFRFDEPRLRTFHRWRGDLVICTVQHEAGHSVAYYRAEQLVSSSFYQVRSSPGKTQGESNVIYGYAYLCCVCSFLFSEGILSVFRRPIVLGRLSVESELSCNAGLGFRVWNALEKILSILCYLEKEWCRKHNFRYRLELRKRSPWLSHGRSHFTRRPPVNADTSTDSVPTPSTCIISRCLRRRKRHRAFTHVAVLILVSRRELNVQRTDA